MYWYKIPTRCSEIRSENYGTVLNKKESYLEKGDISNVFDCINLFRWPFIFAFNISFLWDHSTDCIEPGFLYCTGIRLLEQLNVNYIQLLIPLRTAILETINLCQDILVTLSLLPLYHSKLTCLCVGTLAGDLLQFIKLDILIG